MTTHNINNISDNINKMFERLFQSKEHSSEKHSEHPFFRDLKKVFNTTPDYRKTVVNNIKRRVNYKEVINIPTDVKVEPKYEILKIDELKKLDINMYNTLNYNKIYEIVSYLSKYLIKSNVSDENKIYKKISTSNNNTINIMIIGSGPVGLFLACYLYLYYNDTTMNSSPRVNIVMYDSRINKPGFRKPYNRQRIFSTASKYLSLIIPKIYCWDDSKDYFMVNIFLLEYVLFTVANQHYNIPMIYEDYDWNDYKKIIDKGKFDVVFDCSGGRLKHNVIKSVDASWLKNINLDNSEFKRKLTIKKDDNLVILENDKDNIVNYFFGSMDLYYNDKTLTFHSKYDIDIMNSKDLVYLNKIKDKYYKYEDALSLVQGISDVNFRDFLYTILTKDNSYKSLLVKFDVWGVYMRHQIKISDTFNINERKILLIGAGDTIFHSHFVTGAGLNRIFDFTVKCANQLDRIVN